MEHPDQYLDPFRLPHPISHHGDHARSPVLLSEHGESSNPHALAVAPLSEETEQAHHVPMPGSPAPVSEHGESPDPHAKLAAAPLSKELEEVRIVFVLYLSTAESNWNCKEM